MSHAETPSTPKTNKHALLPQAKNHTETSAFLKKKYERTSNTTYPPGGPVTPPSLSFFYLFLARALDTPVCDPRWFDSLSLSLPPLDKKLGRSIFVDVLS